MELTPRALFTFTITMQELRLICRALGGRLTPEEMDVAKMLDTQIARARIVQGEHQYHELMKLKGNLPEEP